MDEPALCLQRQQGGLKEKLSPQGLSELSIFQLISYTLFTLGKKKSEKDFCFLIFFHSKSVFTS